MRREDWPSALAKVIGEWQGLPFAWGETDCLLFAAACVDAMTGSDIYSEHAGRYKTALGARRRLGGGRDALMETLDEMFERRGVNFARRGDVAFCTDSRETVFGGAVMVVDMNGRSLIAPGESGLMRRPLSDASIAWGVD